MIERTPLPVKLRKELRELRRPDVVSRTQVLVEGPHACSELVRYGITPSMIVTVPNDDLEIQSFINDCELRGSAVYGVSPSTMVSIADARSPQDVLAVVDMPRERTIGELVLILDGVSDPGNIGTIIRTAVWFGFTDLILCGDHADAYAPKVVRSSVGSVFALNVLQRRNASQVQETLRVHHIVAADLNGTTGPEGLRGKKPLAIVIGNEAHGISPDVAALASSTVRINGSGRVESLNAAIASAILMHEAVR
jgi:TrmH family RNA methyltransferase